MDLAEHKYFGEEYLKQIRDANSKGAQIEFVKLPNNSQHHLAKRELYRKAKALLFTIESHEPFGLTVIEALSCGTPVLATRIGSMPEIITQGLNGYLIDMAGTTEDPQNIGAWQRAIGWIEEGLISPEDCRKDAFVRFDRMVAASRYLALFLRLANEHYGRPKVEITEDKK
jgi:glycosyltransferase involved in cell wall biosynthesis